MSGDFPRTATGSDAILNAFHPILDGVNKLLNKSNFVGHGDRRMCNEVVREINEIVVEIKDGMDRLLVVGIPPCRETYPGGILGWEFDIKKDFRVLNEAIAELQKYASEFPPMATDKTLDADENLKHHKTWNESYTAFYALRERLQHKRDLLIIKADQIDARVKPSPKVETTIRDTNSDTKNNPPKKIKRGPRNRAELARFQTALKKGMKRGKTMSEIALDFADGDELRAKALLRKHYRQANSPS